MAAKNIQELYDEARVIYTASTEGENTQVRIGQMFYDLIEHLYEISDVNGTVGPITPTPTPSTLGGPLLTSFNNMPIPTDPDQILHWIDSEDKWEFIDTPTGGGSGGSGDVTWLDLKTDNGSADDNKQINLSHLRNALSGYLENNLTGSNSLYSWWGQKLQKNTNTTPATYRITNAPLEGVTYIRFTNDVILGVDPSSAENTLCVYNSDLTKVGHIYATGGVSALGNSSSGGVSPTPGTPVDLRGLLSHISSSSYSPDYANATAVSNALLALPDNGAGATIRWDGSKWIVDKTIFDDIANITDNGGSFLKKEDDGYSWSDPATGTSGSTTLSGLQDTTISSLAPGQFLYYQDATDEWVNKTFAINSTASISNPVSLQNIIFGGTKYTLPAATSGTPGIMKIGNSTIQTTAANNPTTTTERTYPIQLNSDGQAVVNVPWENTVYSHPTYTAQSSLKLYRITVDNLGHVASTAVADKYDIANVLEGHTSVEISITGSAAKLNESIGSRSIWGQTYWNEGLPQNVQGDLIVEKDTTTNNESIKLSPNTLNVENPKIYMLGRNILEYERRKNSVSVDTLAIGFGAEGNNLTHTNIIGKNIELTSTVGNVYIPNASTLAKGLRIGDAVLYWDSQNNSLAVKKYDDSACNFYAFGGVSALGMSSGIGTVPTMTFGNINVTNKIELGYDSTSSITANNDGWIYISPSEGVEIDNSVIIEGTNLSITNGGYLSVGTGGSNVSKIIFEDNKLWFFIGNTKYGFTPDTSVSIQ